MTKDIWMICLMTAVISLGWIPHSHGQDSSSTDEIPARVGGDGYAETRGQACMNDCYATVHQRLNALDKCDPFFSDIAGSPMIWPGTAGSQLDGLYCSMLQTAGIRSCNWSCMVYHGDHLNLPTPDYIQSPAVALTFLNYMSNPDNLETPSCPISTYPSRPFTECYWNVTSDAYKKLMDFFATGYQGPTVLLTAAHVEAPATQLALIGCVSAQLKNQVDCQSLDCPEGDGYYPDLCRANKEAYCAQLANTGRLICEWSAVATAAHATP